MPWIKVDVDLPRHPKTLRLQALLPAGMNAISVIINLWSWLADFYPDGTVPQFALLPLKVHLGCEIEPLIESGWLDRENDGLHAHDWEIHNSAHVHEALQAAERAKKTRKAKASRRTVTRVTPDRDAGVTRVTEKSRLDKIRSDVDVDVEEQQKQKLREGPEAAPPGPEGQAELPATAAPPAPVVAITRKPYVKPAIDPPVAKSNGVWAAYSTAFFDRYGTAPTRNKPVNAKLCQIVDRIGADAPAVAAFYVGHPKAFYAQSVHSVGILLRDCEGLHAEWRMGRHVTGEEARQREKTAANASGWESMLKEKPKGDAHGVG